MLMIIGILVLIIGFIVTAITITQLQHNNWGLVPMVFVLGFWGMACIMAHLSPKINNPTFIHNDKVYKCEVIYDANYEVKK